MDPTETVEEYYDALRRGGPLAPYFAEREDVVKFGVGERLAGGEAVAEGLREQTRTTEDWRVESRDLRVAGRESVEWFTDDVGLSWTDAGGDRRSFDTRWSGVLELGADAGADEAGDNNASADNEIAGNEVAGADNAGDDNVDDDTGRRWRFVQMHVSAPHDW